MARTILTHSVTLNFNPAEMKKYGVDQSSLSIPANRPVDIHDDLMNHWAIKPLIAGEPLKSAEAAPKTDADLVKAHDAMKAELSATQVQLATAKKDLAATIAHIGEQDEKLAAETAAHDQVKQANAGLSTDLANVRKELDASQTQIAELTAQLGVAHAEIGRLKVEAKPKQGPAEPGQKG